MTVLYGIKNCDTIKKAKAWLDKEQIDYTFHDYRVDGIDSEMVSAFFAQLDWQNVVNKRGTTYRALSDEAKANLSAQTALPLLIEQPAMIKRPILVHQGNYYLGFKPDQYATIFASA
ncbi:ArsC family reductase [Motilimonas eburnea]|uniref:ArsC family reductase n=1 Tax=Motilimonas eburnea TaxID=1737488 RepID=UPI001E43E161|nr:ArsC family reductase [Motilimonas eburnea]MCE2573712.1 ArsC family reductase [Motilimonas eburnea]